MRHSSPVTDNYRSALSEWERPLRQPRKAGSYWDIVTAPAPDDPKATVRFGIRQSTFDLYLDVSWFSPIAQYYGLVQDELHQAKHVFRGAKRSLLTDGDMHADERVLAYTWRAVCDWQWIGTPWDGKPLQIPAPLNSVFFVQVVAHERDEHDVVGAIAHWGWLDEDPHRMHAPISWDERYTKMLW